MYITFMCPIPGTYKKGVYTIKATEVNRFNNLYERHLKLLKLQGKAQKTIDACSRSVRRIRDHFDCCPYQLTMDKSTLGQLEAYFGELVVTHS